MQSEVKQMQRACKRPHSGGPSVFLKLFHTLQEAGFILFFYPSKLVSMNHYPLMRLRTQTLIWSYHFDKKYVCQKRGHVCRCAENKLQELPNQPCFFFFLFWTCSIQSKEQTCSWNADKNILYPSVVLNENTESVAEEAENGICL